MWEEDALSKLPDARPVLKARTWLKECKQRCLPLLMTLSQTERRAEKGGRGGFTPGSRGAEGGGGGVGIREGKKGAGERGRERDYGVALIPYLEYLKGQENFVGEDFPRTRVDQRGGWGGKDTQEQGVLISSVSGEGEGEGGGEGEMGGGGLGGRVEDLGGGGGFGGVGVLEEVMADFVLEWSLCMVWSRALREVASRSNPANSANPANPAASEGEVRVNDRFCFPVGFCSIPCSSCLC
jgi:hypothetical protein